MIEQPADVGQRRPSTARAATTGGLNLPTVSINGATGQELDTALGTVLRFTRGGVAYTVLGLGAGRGGRARGAGAVSGVSRARAPRRSRCAGWSSATAS